MGLTFLILFAVWLTIAYTISHALFFAICVVGVVLGGSSSAFESIVMACSLPLPGPGP